MSTRLSAAAARGLLATLEQDPWFHSLEGQIAEQEKQHNDLHATMFAEYEKMGLGERSERTACRRSRRKLSRRLGQPGKRLSEALRKYRDIAVTLKTHIVRPPAFTSRWRGLGRIRCARFQHGHRARRQPRQPTSPPHPA